MFDVSKHKEELNYLDKYFKEYYCNLLPGQPKRTFERWMRGRKMREQMREQMRAAIKAKEERKLKHIEKEKERLNCKYCEVKFTMANRRTIDHVIPLSKNGGNSKENKLYACEKCNTVKATKTLLEWKEDLEKYVETNKTFCFKFHGQRAFYNISLVKTIIKNIDIILKNFNE